MLKNGLCCLRPAHLVGRKVPKAGDDALADHQHMPRHDGLEVHDAQAVAGAEEYLDAQRHKHRISQGLYTVEYKERRIIY